MYIAFIFIRSDKDIKRALTMAKARPRKGGAYA
jgi:hypothetical protein